MKIFSVLKPGVFLPRHPQEDYFSISNKYPIFVVADGVSLNFDNEDEYPIRSGAGEVAKIFCETVIKAAEKKFKTFTEKDLKKVFLAGNKAVLKYNIAHDRTKETINYWDVDLFSATTSFALIKNNKVYWWSLCDSGVALFNKTGQQFISPNGWGICKRNLPKGWDKMKEKDKVIMQHKVFRNSIDKDGLNGYGVASGEENTLAYLNTGEFDVNEGDVLFVYTDGFEKYFSLKEFIDLFQSWPNDMDKKLEVFTFEKGREDAKKYGSEKTLIAVSIDKKIASPEASDVEFMGQKHP